MTELPGLRRDGYYRSGPTYVDSYLFLRLDADGFCLFHQSMDEHFDFPEFAASLDVEAIKRQHPGGHSCRDERGHWLYSLGRYERQADVPVFSSGDEVCRLADALVMTSWEQKLGDFRLGEMEIVGPSRLKMPEYNEELLFVPDESTAPSAASNPTGR